MVYDIFPFNGEFDVLNIRCNVLNKFVDKFVIIESNVAMGDKKDKPAYFSENIKFAYSMGDEICKKIDVALVPKEECLKIEVGGYHRHDLEIFQKDWAFNKMKEWFKNGDIIIYSDVDEIPNPKSVETFLRDKALFAGYRTDIYRFYLNLYFQPWYHGFFFVWNDSWNKVSFANIKNTHKWLGGLDFPILDNESGWHFSFMGGLEEVKRRIFNGVDGRELTNTTGIGKELDDYIIQSIKDKRFLNHTVEKYLYGQQVPLSQLPEYVQNNQDKYKHILLGDK
jgi:beta-1,4-mannosyl-glycoprotein beta-1,4-N-acetylglucosaminyltransferase